MPLHLRLVPHVDGEESASQEGDALAPDFLPAAAAIVICPQQRERVFQQMLHTHSIRWRHNLGLFARLLLS